jgi:hypothetical protein
MDDHEHRLREEAFALVSAAERLQQDVCDRACAAFVPAALACLEQTLQALSLDCHRAARNLIVPGDRNERASRPDVHAAADWPGAGDDGGSSYERQARLLASLHYAGATLRTAAECCARARDLLAATIEAPPRPGDLHHRSPSPAAAA